MSIDVAIVEDDSRVRKSLAAIISGTPGFQCIGAYPNAETALKQIEENWPDVVLMDISLPKLTGVECVAKLKAARPKLHVLMFTIIEDTDTLFAALMAGASGYLLKDTSPADILSAISNVHGGGSPMSSQIARKIVDYFQTKGHGAGDLAGLSEREMEVLAYLAKGYRYKEIAEVLSISVLTVRSHLQRIYDKLHVRSRTEAVVKYLDAKH